VNLGRGVSKSCQVQRESAAEPTTLAAGWLWKQTCTSFADGAALV
jgi:hypothetical protein